MRCPIDKNVMKEIHAYNAFLDICSECFGVWFDMDELQKMVEKISIGRVDDVVKGTGKVNKEEKKFFWQEGILECPRDYSKMYKNDFGGNIQIHIDRCGACLGVWIDGYEIKRLENYLKPNPAMDSMAKAIIDEMNESEAWKMEVKEAPFKIFSMIRSPAYLFYVIIDLLIKAGISYLDKKNTEADAQI